MTITYQKLQLLQSLNNLDAEQSEEVLNFIRALTGRTGNDLHQRRDRTRAMKEIGQALLEIRSFRP